MELSSSLYSLPNEKHTYFAAPTRQSDIEMKTSRDSLPQIHICHTLLDSTSPTIIERVDYQ
jgi:hypothetical protein